MRGAHDIRTGRTEDGRFAIQFSIRKDDPVAIYVMAAAEVAACRLKDPVSGFVEDRAPDAGAVEDVTQVLLNLLPEDLRERFAQENIEVQSRACNQVDSLFGAIGGLSGALGLLRPFVGSDHGDLLKSVEQATRENR